MLIAPASADLRSEDDCPKTFYVQRCYGKISEHVVDAQIAAHSRHLLRQLFQTSGKK